MSSYEKEPFVEISSSTEGCSVGWPEIWNRITARWRSGLLCIECYPGVFEQEIGDTLAAAIPGVSLVWMRELFCSGEEIGQTLAADLTEDRVFGRISRRSLLDLMDPVRVAGLRRDLEQMGASRIAVIGCGASLVVPGYDLVVYADLARWEIQKRQRAGLIASLGMQDEGSSAGSLYKRAFFVDWRLADGLKQTLLPCIDFLLDTNKRQEPKLITGEVLRSALAVVAQRPFRVVPFFDPGPWGGQWMRKVCDLPNGPANYAWCFDCVPEENSLLLGFGPHRVEIPALDLVFAQTTRLLGEAVSKRFGAEFPIRFDFLDTMGGGNLSLQVHPLKEYIREHFGMTYTQDESYYLLDAEADACVYLGFREEIEPQRMILELNAAQSTNQVFRVDNYVNRFPVKKHDHVSIPAGTIHCAGKNSMVLEISATPYIFTFKLWDWERLGMDGHPRPIHLQHGIANLQWDRDTEWVRRELLVSPQPVSQGDGWREERTGLDKRQFIETRRHWFTHSVPHDTAAGVNVLNLVEGERAVVESPDHAFEPFLIHYAETFIIPAAVGAYTIRPDCTSDTPLATIKAYVRRPPE